MDWYYSQNSQQAGPVSQEELAELFRNGTVNPTDLVWNETMAEWTPIGKVAAFATAAQPVSEPALSSSLPSPFQDTPPSLAAAPYHPPQAYGGSAPGNEPPTYLWQAIVVTVLCCIPLGIPAIIFSTKVKPAYQSGDYAAALDASKKAKTWCLVALILGLIANVLIIGLNAVAIISEVSRSGGL